MKKHNVAATVACLLMGWASTAQAIELFSTLSPTGAYSSNYGLNVRGSEPDIQVELQWAASFTPSQTLALDSIDLGLQVDPTSGVDDVEISLFSSAFGAPGALLESLGVLSGFPDFNSTNSILQTATSTLNPLLEVGTEYFVVVSPADPLTYATWNVNSENINLSLFLSVDQGLWEARSNPHPAFRVNGVPEPGALSLLAIGGLLVGRRRR